MAELRGGSSVSGYPVLHSGLDNAYLKGNLLINSSALFATAGKVQVTGGLIYVTDGESGSGTLRIGSAWNKPGLFNETSGKNLVLGSASGQIDIQDASLNLLPQATSANSWSRYLQFKYVNSSGTTQQVGLIGDPNGNIQVTNNAATAVGTLWHSGNDSNLIAKSITNPASAIALDQYIAGLKRSALFFTFNKTNQANFTGVPSDLAADVIVTVFGGVTYSTNYYATITLESMTGGHIKYFGQLYNNTTFTGWQKIYPQTGGGTSGLPTTGGTMTGNITMGTGVKIDFYDEIADKVLWYSTDYTTGICGSTLYDKTYQYRRIYRNTDTPGTTAPTFEIDTVNKTGLIAGNFTIGDGANAPSTTITSGVEHWLEIRGTTATYPNKNAIVMHHQGISTSALIHANTDANTSYWEFISDDTTNDVKVTGGNVYLTTQGKGVYLKDETTGTNWHIHTHGDRLRGYNGSSEHVYLASGDTLPYGTTFGGGGAAEGGELRLAKPASGTSLAGDISIDVAGNLFRIFENGGGYRGLAVDLTGCGAQSTIWHSSNLPVSFEGYANNVVKRDANGDIKCGRYMWSTYYNASCGIEDSNTATCFWYSTADNFLRKMSVAQVKTQLGIGSASVNTNTGGVTSVDAYSIVRGTGNDITANTSVIIGENNVVGKTIAVTLTGYNYNNGSPYVTVNAPAGTFASEAFQKMVGEWITIYNSGTNPSSVSLYVSSAGDGATQTFNCNTSVEFDKVGLNGWYMLGNDAIDGDSLEYVNISGYDNFVRGEAVHIVGMGNNVTEGQRYISILGNANLVRGKYVTINGTNNEVTVHPSYAGTPSQGLLINGQDNSITSTSNSIISGVGHYMNRLQYCALFGKYGSLTYEENTGYANGMLAFGNGSSTSARGLAFKVYSTGQTYADGAYSSAGADYSEYFEWEDGNPDGEDRVGYFVTIAGGKIRKAQPGDVVFGIVSATPSIVGDSAGLSWNGRYLKDEWGRPIEEKIEVPEQWTPEGECIPAHTEVRYMQNPAWRPDLHPYTPREKRKEWSPMGSMGKLRVRDSGLCQVDGYCRCGVDGIAVPSANGYKVLERINDHIILVWVDGRI